MTWTAHTSSDLPAPAEPYSHVMEAGGLVGTAGFGPQDPATGVVPGGITAQTDQVLDNVKGALPTVDSPSRTWSRRRSTSSTWNRNFAACNQVYAQRFTPPYLARTTVGNTLAGILVEVDVVAVRRTTS